MLSVARCVPTRARCIAQTARLFVYLEKKHVALPTEQIALRGRLSRAVLKRNKAMLNPQCTEVEMEHL
jgi:hypothetical protein